ncbi:hypothetical protein ATI61_105402 [Archangium gephyra]|uniref:Uncharacterized protein n=1 Tax=Archangium gephyra TaxID=48 RepID=A0AAC8TJG3_9BACT|nr:hypothetical protein [Archangium gephyra]AKJ06616.1 Hypothetical protein AA314_08242 [Archangium gephyra]REG32075.1 hypothetical protein ATI61_105402 [Archangium gephyra]
MNARILAAFLCLSAASTGCIIIDGDGGYQGYEGDVTFLWTFAPNGRCSDVPEVKNIQISITGEALHNGGVYACNTAGVDGIVLHDFAPGNYPYTIRAIGYDGDTLFEGRGTFTVNGDVRVNIDLTPNGMSYALVSWYFPNNASCYQAGVSYIRAQIDGGEWVTLNCADGMANGGVETPWLADGTHTIQMVAYGRDRAGRDDLPLYNTSGRFSTSAGSPRSESFQFFAVGGMSLRWELWDSSTTRRTCAEAGLTGMVINLRHRETDTLVYGSAGDPQSCTGAPILYQFLKPGTYEVYIRGMKGSVVAYSNEDLPDVLTVTAFEQKTVSDVAYTVALAREY